MTKITIEIDCDKRGCIHCKFLNRYDWCTIYECSAGYHRCQQCLSAEADSRKLLDAEVKEGE
jgi:hypothetical protein